MAPEERTLQCLRQVNTPDHHYHGELELSHCTDTLVVPLSIPGQAGFRPTVLPALLAVISRPGFYLMECQVAMEAADRRPHMFDFR